MNCLPTNSCPKRVTRLCLQRLPRVQNRCITGTWQSVDVKVEISRCTCTNGATLKNGSVTFMFSVPVDQEVQIKVQGNQKEKNLEKDSLYVEMNDLYVDMGSTQKKPGSSAVPSTTLWVRVIMLFIRHPWRDFILHFVHWKSTFFGTLYFLFNGKASFKAFFYMLSTGRHTWGQFLKFC